MTIQRVDYVKLNPTCSYCGKPATVVRVTQQQGRPAVATLCLEDARGECEDSLGKLPGSVVRRSQLKQQLEGLRRMT